LGFLEAGGDATLAQLRAANAAIDRKYKLARR
jgi:hypothetical protein